MKLFSRGKPLPEPSPEPEPDPDWHKAFGTVVNNAGQTVTNRHNWRRCECDQGADHDG
jgi:hypothetical protein